MLLFASFWIYTSAFTHQHFQDGQWVAHSHPFAEESPAQHSHTSFELHNIAAASNLTLGDLYCPVPNAQELCFDNHYYILPETSESLFAGRRKSSRAPPVGVSMGKSIGVCVA